MTPIGRTLRERYSASENGIANSNIFVELVSSTNGVND
jgi:hypothetical protein